MNFGIDMLSIGAKEYGLKSLNGWGIKSGNKVGEEQAKFGRTADGHELQGAGYFLNRSMKGDSPNLCTWDVNLNGLFVTVNPSALHHGWELTPDPTPAVDAIRHDMELLGIEFDMQTASLNRIDLTKQAVMNSALVSFHPTFSALQGQRMKKTEYPDGFQFKNTQKEVVFYNKSLQLSKVKGIDDAPENLLRCEARWKHRKVIGHDVNGIGVGSFDDLLSRPSADLANRYKTMLHQTVFKPNQGQQLTFDFGREVEVLRSYIEDSERNGWSRYVMARGLESILHEFGSLDMFGELLKVFYSERQVRRNMQQLRTTLFKQAAIDRMKERQSLTASIDLLRQTFAA